MNHGRVESASLSIGKVARRAGIGVETIRRFSYALAAAFATWALSRSILFPQGRTVTAGAAAGGVTLLGVLMAGGCATGRSDFLAAFISPKNQTGIWKEAEEEPLSVDVESGFVCLH